jgi:hypothetical protein
MVKSITIAENNCLKKKISNYYSTLTIVAHIILFVEMLKFSTNMFFKDKKFVKQI